MRRGALAAALLLSGCAHIEAPRGGPEDRAAPILIGTRPDTMSVQGSYGGAAVLVFDETISEQGLEELVSVSPRTSPVSVDNSGSELRVSLRRGWVPGQIYQITVAPGIRDLFQNRTAQTYELVFSTGPAIPDTRLAGTVYDRITGRAAQGARVEAIRTTDSLVYALAADSGGAFVFRRIPAGTYRLRAFNDVNRNRLLEVFEARDSVAAALAVGAGATLPEPRLSLLRPDTTPPRPGSATLAAGWIQVRFDDHLDPGQALGPAQVGIVGPDSLPVAVAEVRLGEPPAARRDTAAADSVVDGPVPDRNAADTVRFRNPEARPDTAAALPSQTLSIRPAGALRAATDYRIRLTGIRNVNGLVGSGESPLRTPAPPPPPPRPNLPPPPPGSDRTPSAPVPPPPGRPGTPERTVPTNP